MRACLALLSGRRHQVLTALVLIAPDGARPSALCDTRRRVRPADRGAARRLCRACGEGVGKAGGYAIQGRAAAFIRLLLGSYSGVVGLPLFETAQLLRGRGYPVP